MARKRRFFKRIYNPLEPNKKEGKGNTCANMKHTAMFERGGEKARQQPWNFTSPFLPWKNTRKRRGKVGFLLFVFPPLMNTRVRPGWLWGLWGGGGSWTNANEKEEEGKRLPSSSLPREEKEKRKKIFHKVKIRGNMLLSTPPQNLSTLLLFLARWRRPDSIKNRTLPFTFFCVSFLSDAMPNIVFIW